MRKLIGAVLIAALLVPTVAEARRRTPERLTGYASRGCKVYDNGKGKRFECGHGNDAARGTIFADVFHMGAGHDRVGARAGKDTVWGGKGADVIYGKHGNDRMRGGRGADRIMDSSGAPDHDVVLVHPGKPDYIDVRDGDFNDVIFFCPGATAVVLWDNIVLSTDHEFPGTC